MANKMYTVMKDGMELSTLKTLASAKKLADAEGAEVFSEGRCVYQGIQQARVTVEPVIAQTPSQPDEERVETTRYRLKTLMNVRKHPSLDSAIVAIKPAGTVVRVLKIENDWMHLSDGNFILFNRGEFAEIFNSPLLEPDLDASIS